MQRINSTFYVISLIVIFVFASFFYSWKVIIPEYQKNKTDLRTLEQEIMSANTKLESLKVAQGDIADLGPTFDQLFVAMSKDKDEPNTISEIEAIAFANKLVVPSIQITDGSPSEELSSASAVLISFNVNGSFDDINKMTKALEDDLKFMNIKNISLSSGDTGLLASYQIEAYRVGEIASLSADASSSSVTTSDGSTTNEGGL